MLAAGERERGLGGGGLGVAAGAGAGAGSGVGAGWGQIVAGQKLRRQVFPIRGGVSVKGAFVLGGG